MEQVIAPMRAGQGVAVLPTACTSMVAVAPRLKAGPAKFSVPTGAWDQLIVVVLAAPCWLPRPRLALRLTALPSSVRP